VIDFEAPSSKSAIEAIHVGRTKELLLKFATWLMGSQADAEDLLADAMVCVCDPTDGRPWDRARATFSTHMRIILRDLATRERRSARARREVLEAAFVFDESFVHPAPEPDEALAEARAAARRRELGGRVRAVLPLRAVQVFDLACQGDDDAAEAARLIGCSVKEVYEANRQIARQAARVLEEERRAAAARMKELRERAMKRKESP
jgi:DNA-directed RNA polymerase specialized sigma24 family protein